MIGMFTIRHVSAQTNSFVARDAEHALALAVETVPKWSIDDLTATEVDWPTEWLDYCALEGIFGVLTSQRRHDVYIGGKLLPRKLIS